MQREALGNYVSNVQLHISAADYFTCTSSWRYMRFTSDFNRLYFFLGEGGYVKIDDYELHPTRGQLVVLPAGTMLSVCTLNDKVFSKYYCHFTAMAGELNLFQLLDTPYCINVADIDKTSARFGELVRHYHEDRLTSMLRAKTELQELLCDFLERGGETKLRQAANSSVGKVSLVLKYLEDHLSDNVTLEQLAELVHFHPNYLIRFFKSVTGRSPIQYLNQRRMEKAKELMLTSELTISETADRIGSSLYQFSKMFKQHTGYSPTDYRKMMRPKV